MRAPSTNPITLPFGSTDPPYNSTSPHRGTDFSYLPDDTIYAPFSGKVTQIPNNGNDGNASYLTDSQGRYHGLLHASKYLVPNGSNVQEGQPIAVMGSSGYAIGKHLHYAVKENGQFIDPMSLITEGEKPVSMVNDGDTTNYFLALFDREPTQAELDKNRDKEWNNPDPKYRAPLYDDMIGRGRYLSDEVKRLQKIVDDSGTQYKAVDETLYRKES